MGAIASSATITVAGITDGPGSYTGKALEVVRVNSAETGLEYHAMAYSDLDLLLPTIPTNSSFSLSGLSDVSATEGSAINGYSLVWNQTAGKWEPTLDRERRVDAGRPDGRECHRGLRRRRVVSRLEERRHEVGSQAARRRSRSAGPMAT